MKTTNTYHLPINLSLVTSIQSDSKAHVGDLIYSIDYDAPEGTPVFAAFDGTVTEVKDDSSRGGDDPVFDDDGNYIAMLHDNNEVSWYEHLRFQSSKVAVGDRVVAGHIIAEVGNTGWSECPHLHFMVYPNGLEYKTLEIEFAL